MSARFFSRIAQRDAAKLTRASFLFPICLYIGKKGNRKLARVKLFRARVPTLDR